MFRSAKFTFAIDLTALYIVINSNPKITFLIFFPVKNFFFRLEAHQLSSISSSNSDFMLEKIVKSILTTIKSKKMISSLLMRSADVHFH